MFDADDVMMGFAEVELFIREYSIVSDTYAGEIIAEGLYLAMASIGSGELGTFSCFPAQTDARIGRGRVV